MPDDSGGGDAGGMPPAVQCPNCGCQFDPATGDVLNSDSYDQGQGEQGGGPPPSDSGPPAKDEGAQ